MVTYRGLTIVRLERLPYDDTIFYYSVHKVRSIKAKYKNRDEIVDIDRLVDKMHPQNIRRTSSIIYFQDGILLPRYVMVSHKESETSMNKFNSDRIR